MAKKTTKGKQVKVKTLSGTSPMPPGPKPPIKTKKAVKKSAK